MLLLPSLVVGFVTDRKKFMSNLEVVVVLMFLWHKMHSLSIRCMLSVFLLAHLITSDLGHMIFLGFINI